MKTQPISTVVALLALSLGLVGCGPANTEAEVRADLCGTNDMLVAIAEATNALTPMYGNVITLEDWNGEAGKTLIAACDTLEKTVNRILGAGREDSQFHLMVNACNAILEDDVIAKAKTSEGLLHYQNKPNRLEHFYNVSIRNGAMIVDMCN